MTRGGDKYYFHEYMFNKGKMTDLYDFDYDAPFPSPDAAVVQASGLGNGANEQVYKYEILFEGAFWSDAGYIDLDWGT